MSAMDSSTSDAAATTNNVSTRSRSPLFSRLQALVDDSKESLSSSLSESPRNSAEHVEHSSPNHTTLPSSSSSNAMWRTQQLTHPRISSSSSSFRSVSRTKRTAPASNMSPPRVHPPIAPFSSSNSLPSTSALTLPILRWFGKQSTGQHHLPRSHSISRSPPPLNSDGELSASSSRSSICSSPTSPPSALREAFEDDIRLCHSPSSSHCPSPDALQRPAPACLPNTRAGGFGPGRVSVRRSPPFLESLARSTLPTSSVTVTLPQPIFRHPTDQFNPIDQPSSVLSSRSRYSRAFGPRSRPIVQSPPTRTSIDTLRSLRDRGSSVDTSQTRSFNTSWWFGANHKASVDELLDERDRADTIEGEAAKIRERYKAPTNPVVFCHGLLGFDTVKVGPSIAPVEVTHWRGIKEVLEANGIEVLITRVPATSSPMERAKVLESVVSEKYPGRSVHLIGHSMGGLDCRYLTTHLKHRQFQVLSITTVATPHRGSSFADHFIETVGKNRIPSFVALLDLLPNGGGNGKAFESLTLESMRKFNEETPDVEGVQYFSWGAVVEPGLMDPFRWPHSVIMEKEGPNDGLVSVVSAKWGTYLGTLDDVNHLDLVGWINTARYKWAEFTGREIKFKPATFYLGVADHLARHVEGPGSDAQLTKEDLRAAESTKAGAGVKTVEGVEQSGPASSPPSPLPKDRLMKIAGRQ